MSLDYPWNSPFEMGVMLTLVLGAAVLSIARIYPWPGHKLTPWGTAEAFAHIWVGFAAAVIAYDPDLREIAAWSLGIGAAVETIMFILWSRGWYVR